MVPTDRLGGPQLDPGGRGGGVRATAARYALLPLRLFLGFTFVYAGLDKLTDADYPASMAGLLESIPGAAAPWLLDLAMTNPERFGYAIAFGEIAVGLGTLLGLWARLAAFGGALISLSFWLTISWDVEAYYYSQDLPYLMAWVPLIMAGAPVYSLDAVISQRKRRKGQQIFG
ncbi:DoxX family protein [Streptomyces gobiensis]|uniref:DoxX family protein n=1 Tax=Streptomyces gobiensis TaxID=2875706 RepID=UPI001E531D0A|nr:DoxX family protein [Streptomyces gobiensis]UGY93186.1 DoxX family protein [Streptomyces gobiensis]